MAETIIPKALKAFIPTLNHAPEGQAHSYWSEVMEMVISFKAISYKFNTNSELHA